MPINGISQCLDDVGAMLELEDRRLERSLAEILDHMPDRAPFRSAKAPPRANPAQPQPGHRRRAVSREMVPPSSRSSTRISRRPGDLVGGVVEPDDLGLDPRTTVPSCRGLPSEPGAETRPAGSQQSGRPGDAEVALFRVHQCERFSFQPESSWAQKREAILEAPDPSSAQCLPCVAGSTWPARSHSAHPLHQLRHQSDVRAARRRLLLWLEAVRRGTGRKNY